MELPLAFGMRFSGMDKVTQVTIKDRLQLAAFASDVLHFGGNATVHGLIQRFEQLEIAPRKGMIDRYHESVAAAFAPPFHDFGHLMYDSRCCFAAIIFDLDVELLTVWEGWQTLTNPFRYAEERRKPAHEGFFPLMWRQSAGIPCSWNHSFVCDLIQYFEFHQRLLSAWLVGNGSRHE